MMNKLKVEDYAEILQPGHNIPFLKKDSYLIKKVGLPEESYMAVRLSGYQDRWKNKKFRVTGIYAGDGRNYIGLYNEESHEGYVLDYYPNTLKKVEMPFITVEEMMII